MNNEPLLSLLKQVRDSGTKIELRDGVHVIIPLAIWKRVVDAVAEPDAAATINIDGELDE